VVAIVLGSLLILGSAVAGTAWYVRRSVVAAPPAPGPTTPAIASTTPTPSPSASASPTATTTASPTPSGYPDFAALYAAVSSGVAEIDATTCDGQSTGTGFLVGRDRLVTAAHVINGASSVTVKTDAGNVKAVVAGVDKTADLAVLTLAKPATGHVFTLADHPSRTGTRIVTIGFPLGGPKTLTEGAVSGSGRKIRTESGTLTDMLQTDTPINPGNSGGPFLDLSGDVIGLADAVRTDANGIGFAVPASAIASRLSGASAWTKVVPVDCSSGGDESDLAVSAVISYLLAVNTGDYDLASDVVTSGFKRRNLGSESAWAKAYATTYDDDFGLVDVNVDGSSADVWLTFRSQQDPGYGPAGAKDATCLRWEIVYRVVRSGGDWRLDSAKTVDKPGWIRC
jgi:serine protease Do